MVSHRCVYRPTLFSSRSLFALLRNPEELCNIGSESIGYPELATFGSYTLVDVIDFT